MPTSSPTLSEVESLRERVREQSHQIEILKEMLRELRREKFGRKSEKLTLQEQMGMFNEAEETAATSLPEEGETETITYTRQKPKRKPLPDNLPRVDKIIELNEAERICPKDGSLMREIGEEISEKLEVIPMKLWVTRTIRKKYSCACCEEGVRVAPLPAQAIPKSMAASSTLSAVLTMKYVDHLPLYRVESIFSRHGVEISRGTLAHWMVRCGELFQPLINLLSEKCEESGYLQMDETRVQVLREPGKKATSQSYMWMRLLPDPDTPICLYEYDPTRSGEVPKKLLAGFRGYLQADGYDGYNAVEGTGSIIRLGCWAHARRKFDVAKRGKNSELALHALNLIGRLYRIEEMIRGKAAEDRYRIRQEKAKPILDELRAWITKVKPTVPPSLDLGKALTYADNEWKYLTIYIEDGRLEIDNNAVENAIRPFALGRKNWLFSATVEGAQASANVYSLIETAKLNDLEPYKYLKYLLTRLPQAATLAEIEDLLPTHVKPDMLS